MNYGKFPKINEVWRPTPFSDGSFNKDGWVKVVGINLKGYKGFDKCRPGLIVVHKRQGKWDTKNKMFHPCISYQYFIDDMHAKYYERDDVIKRKKKFVFPLDEGDYIHEWFELTYAQYLTIPRSILQSMPSTWQKDFVRLLKELDETYDWLPKEGCYHVTLQELVESRETPGEMEWGRELEDPFQDYNRGRREIEKEVPVNDVKTCSSCGGMKKHHHDHAPNGFETCKTCSGTGKEISTKAK